MNWADVQNRLQADRRRLLEAFGDNAGPLAFHPSFVCVWLYRVANYQWRRGRPVLARCFWQLNFLLTGADISPATEIGEGLLILSPAGVALMGTAGRNLTVMPCSGFGGEMGRPEDIGAGPGLPLLEDDVVLEPHCGILGPVRVGSRVRVGAGAILTKDVPDDTVVEGPPPRFVGRRRCA